MSLGAGAKKVGGAGQCSSMRGYPWQPFEQPPTGTVTLNNSVEYLPVPYLKREERIGKTKAQNGTQTASYCNNTL